MNMNYVHEFMVVTLCSSGPLTQVTVGLMNTVKMLLYSAECHLIHRLSCCSLNVRHFV